MVEHKSAIVFPSAVVMIMIIQVKNIQSEYLDGGFVALKKYTKSKMI